MEDTLTLNGSGIEYIQNLAEQFSQVENIVLKGASIDYILNDTEKIVNDTTKIQGFSIELIDYPFYAFDIIEIRL